MHVKWWVILVDRMGPEIKGQVVNRVRLHVKISYWLLDWNALLTRKWPMFLSRLNEISGGRGNVCFRFEIIAENVELFENDIFDCKVLWTVLPTCPFSSNMVNISGPNQSAKITHNFSCISINFIYCITCTLCKEISKGQSGRRLADRFREHLRVVEKNDTNARQP